MTVKANELAIKALRPKDQPYEVAVSEHRGLVVRVHPSGERVFRLRYRQDGVLKRIKLDAATFAQARKEWIAHTEGVKTGEDPAANVKQKRAEKQLKRQAERAAPTVAELIRDFIELYAKRRKRSWRADERMLVGVILPQWGNIKAAAVQRRDVVDLLDRIAAKTPVRANRLLAATRKMFNWALDRDILLSSPCSRVKPPAKEKARKRVLSDAEIKQFWNELPESGISADVQLALRIQLLTASRIGEVLGAHAREFESIQGAWLNPGEDRSKNSDERLIPLSKMAYELIEPLTTGNGFLFPRSGKSGHVRVDVATHELADSKFRETMAHFTSHDLRRTAATQISALGTSRVVLGSILNHKDRSVDAIYDRHRYEKEKRIALEAWARRLEKIVSDKTSNVLPLRPARTRA